MGGKACTTAIVFLMTKDKYFTANIGDSRAVLSINSKAVPCPPTTNQICPPSTTESKKPEDS